MKNQIFILITWIGDRVHMHTSKGALRRPEV